MADAHALRATQRLDQWLWHARLFKTRTLAAKFVAGGAVRLSRGDETMRVTKPSFALCSGDTLVFTRNDRLRIILVKETAARRGPAAEAAALYDDQSPPPPPRKTKPPAPFSRDKGAGRPTKKDRRALSALRS
ncbi:MAG: S4 domain-containing protein [Pseudomonadota bacterium]